ncbi:hypothetical protein J7L48_07650, partial [bacterium]|nr:hypothetical protein [bacterium]
RESTSHIYFVQKGTHRRLIGKIVRTFLKYFFILLDFFFHRRVKKTIISYRRDACLRADTHRQAKNAEKDIPHVIQQQAPGPY